mgnify:CR=1 FL=1
MLFLVKVLGYEAPYFFDNSSFFSLSFRLALLKKYTPHSIISTPRFIDYLLIGEPSHISNSTNLKIKTFL